MTEQHKPREVPTTGSWPVSSYAAYWPYALFGGLLLAIVLAAYWSGSLRNLRSADFLGGIVDGVLSLVFYFLVL